MGNRANIVLVDDDGWQLRYSHWDGWRLADALIGGPEPAKRYILAQPDGEFWTDELWCDGGLLLDVVKRKVMFYGEAVMASMNERRALFEVLAALWPGYEILWAYDGTEEIARYVGADINPRDTPCTVDVTLCSDTNKLHHLVTVVNTAGELRAWPLWWGSSAALHGPGLLDMLPGPGAPQLNLGVIPESGVHVNLRNKTVGVWATSAVPGLYRWLPELWPGWAIERWDDRYEEHLTKCGPGVTAPDLDMDAGLEEVQKALRKRVFERYEDSAAGGFARLASLFGVNDPGPFGAPTTAAERPTPPEWATFTTTCARIQAERQSA